ncbi:hypothetical protein G9A89_022923 [Geosiphon pyriformis]|nr:hypothetical protein G9A89_022923 [Geosiphon pyriformis]
MEAVSSGSLSSSKASLSASFGPAGGSFSQKKRISLCNVKHSGIKGGVSLAKFHSDRSMYSDMESDSSSSIVNDILVGNNNKSFLGSAATTPRAKRVKNDLACGSPFGSLDYDIDDDNGGFLPSPLAVKNKLATAKIQVIRKLFSKINGFGETTTSSKFEEIIRSTFTLEISMEKATSLAKKEGITVNINLKKQGICSDWAIIIKKIPMDTPKRMIVAALSEFGQAVVEFAKLSQVDLLAAKWSFLIGKDSVQVAKAVGNCETWTSRDQFRALLFTLPVGTTAHDLGNLLEGAGEKMCSNEMLESAFCTVPILGGVKLSWVRLGLVWCDKCGKLGHLVLECDAEIASTPKPPKSFIKRVILDENCLQLAKLYAKKSVPIFRPTAFGSKL